MRSQKMTSFGMILILMGIFSSGIIYEPSLGSRECGSCDDLGGHGIQNGEQLFDSEIQRTNVHQHTYYEGGTILWEYDTGSARAISTPALGDLDGDGKMEIVFACSNNKIYALTSSGEEYWSEPYGDDEIVPADEAYMCAINHVPPPIFSSVTLCDVDGSKPPEVLCGVKDGVLCLNFDGSLNWKKGLTNGYYFSTPSVTDLEGEFGGDKDELEVVIGSDGTDHNAWIEAFHNNGADIFRYQVITSGEPGFVTMPPICQDLDGSFEKYEDPGSMEGEETWHELVVGSRHHGLRVFSHSGTQQNGVPAYSPSTWECLAGHQTYGAAAIGNFSMSNNNDPWEHEIIIPSSDGYMQTWDDWIGNLYCYDRNGSLLWTFNTGAAPSSIFTSPAVADVHVSKYELSEEINYEVFFGADNGVVYSLNCDTQEVLWSYMTGGRILSSPAICNIDSDDELEVVIGSDEGSVYCFDGDPSDDGEPHDDGMEDGGCASGEYDILWKCDTGGSGVGISSPVVADINGDGMLEVVIGDKGGRVYCIAAGGRSVKYQCDWPTFHHDLNHTGFYEIDARCGVSLSPWRNPDGLPESLVKNVEPSETVGYNISIENTGIGGSLYLEDTYTISVDGVQGGWSSKIVEGYDGMLPDGSIEVTLEAGEMRKLVLNVTAPSHEITYDTVLIDLAAISKNDATVRDDLSTVSHLSFILDFDVEFTDPVRVTDESSPFNEECFKEVTPGCRNFATIELRNLGNINDSYNLDIETLGEGFTACFADWDSDSIKGYGLPAPRYNETGAEVTIGVAIDVPSDAMAGALLQINVGVSSISSLEITPEDSNDLLKRVATANFQASRSGSISISCDEVLKYVDAGQVAIFELRILNDFNMPLEVDLEVTGVHKHWGVVFEENIPGIIEIGGWRMTEVKVTSPGDAMSWERLSFSIVASARNLTEIGDELELMVMVNPVFDILATMEPPIVHSDPGDFILFDINIMNKGNGENEIHPVMQSCPTGWSGVFGRMDQDNEFVLGDRFYLEPNTETDSKFRLEVPMTSKPGVYRTIINITGLEGSFQIVSSDIVVSQVFDISLRTYSGRDVWNGNIGYDDPITQTLEIWNRGNDEDVITLRIMGLGTDWYGFFDSVGNTPVLTCEPLVSNFNETIEIESYGQDMVRVPDDYSSQVSNLSLKLDERSYAWISVVIISPINVPFGCEPSIHIDARSSGEEVDRDDNRVAVNLTIDRPNICISGGMELFEQIKANDHAVFGAKIENRGCSDARNVEIQFKVDGAVVEQRILPITPENFSATLEFDWRASSGHHVIEIITDPDNTITESNEADNVIDRAISVSAERDGISESLSGNGSFVTVVALVLIGGIAGVLYLLRKLPILKKGKQIG